MSNVLLSVLRVWIFFFSLFQLYCSSLKSGWKIIAYILQPQFSLVSNFHIMPPPHRLLRVHELEVQVQLGEGQQDWCCGWSAGGYRGSALPPPAFDSQLACSILAVSISFLNRVSDLRIPLFYSITIFGPNLQCSWCCPSG